MSENRTTPELSLVIPVYNQWGLTKRCLESLIQCSRSSQPGPSAEVIVIDNGSFDETRTELAKMAAQFTEPERLQLQVLTQNKNLGFAAGSNAGAKVARGRWLFFLNNDTEAFPGSIAAMVRALTDFPSVGLVGARLLYPNRTIQHAGMAMDGLFQFHHIFRYMHGTHPLVMERRAFYAVTGAAMMMARADFEKCGGFDEGYKNSYEDVDLCLKVREMGKEVIYEPEAVFIHYESMSAGRTLHQNRNRKLFLERWRSKLSTDLIEKTEHYADKQLFRLANDLEREGGAKAEDVNDISPLRLKSLVIEGYLFDQRARRDRVELEAIRASRIFRLVRLVLKPVRQLRTWWLCRQEIANMASV